MQKMDGRRDPRLVPGGWFVRASGLDELPQIVNVLRGEMSLVGPRPCVAYEFDQYTTEQKQRCEALPGLTGLWQVSGKNRTTFETMIQLDISYKRQCSLWLDLKIIGLTIPALIGQVLDTTQQRALRGTTVTPAAPSCGASGSLSLQSERKSSPNSGAHAEA
jgi:lipopolysaccharide/colanic/teichoic acid biosynthesis glycosyltransferase